MTLDAALELFWHPVATLDELREAAPHPLAVDLLGRRLALADLGERVLATVDRCPHRSTRLSIGSVEPEGIRCAYHGWRFGPDGRCDDLPAMPEGPIPGRACLETFDAEVAYGLVWVCLDGSAGTSIPACPAWTDGTMRVLTGAPYTWPTSAPRRVENFVDLAHFAWVHDGTLGRRDQPVPQLPEIRREDGELRFEYRPPDQPVEDTAMFGSSRYRMPMPLTVNIDFTLDTGAHRTLWMTASPVDRGTSRSFWLVCRDDDLDEQRDADHLAFQQVVLDEDEPVVCNQEPAELPLEPGTEVSVRTDRVSIEYRRWLRELAEAADLGPASVRALLASTAPQPV